MGLRKNKAGRFESARTDDETAKSARDEWERLTPAEREFVMQAMAEFHAAGESETFVKACEADYDREVVSVRQFFHDEYYVGEEAGKIHTCLMDDLEEIFTKDYHEVVLGGSLGWGKSTQGRRIMRYMIYQALCLADPAQSYGLKPNDPVTFANIAVRVDVARKVLFEQLAEELKASPFFQEIGFKVTRAEIKFPKGLRVAPGTSSETALIGQHVFGGLMDECLSGESLVLLSDGSTRTCRDLFGGVINRRQTQVLVNLLAYDNGRLVEAEAFVKAASFTDVYEVLLEDGSSLRATEKHPFLVRRVQSDCTTEFFVFVRDLQPGDQIVVVEGPCVVQGQGDVRGDEEEAVGGAERARLQRGDLSEDVRGCQASSSRSDEVAGQELAEGHLRGEESVLREEALRRDEGEDRSSSCRNEGEETHSQEDVDRADWVDAIGENAGVDLNRQCHVDLDWNTGVCRETHGAEDNLWFCVLSRDSRGGSRSDLGGRSGSHGLHLRDGGDSVSRRAWVEATCRSRLLGSQAEWAVVSPGGQQAGSGSCPNEEGQVQGTHELLQGQWPCASSVEQAASDEEAPAIRSREAREERFRVRTSRVVSVTHVGREQTYDLCCPAYGTFVANGIVTHNTNFFANAYMGPANRARWGVQSKAEKVYSSIVRRMKARYLKVGKLPGLLVLMSSKKTVDDFTEKRIREAEAKNDSSIFYREYALWDVNRTDYSKKTFRVLVGNEVMRSRILSSDECVELPEGTQIIDVPEDFHSDFESDLEGAIRDYAGVATVAIEPFIPMREKLALMVDRGFSHPFPFIEWTAGRPLLIDWSKLLRVHVRRGLIPLCCPDAVRHAHADLSVTRCATGFAVGHVCGVKDVVRREGLTQVKRSIPVIRFDVILRIVPPLGEEIVLSEINGLIKLFVQKGLPIHSVSFDQFQSVSARQELAADGFETSLISTEAREPYDTFKQAIYEERIRCYEYEPLMQELRGLERDNRTGKVTFKQGGSKDVADAACGVVYRLVTKAPSAGASSPLPPSMGESIVVVAPSVNGPDYDDESAGGAYLQRGAIMWTDETEEAEEEAEGRTSGGPFLMG